MSSTILNKFEKKFRNWKWVSTGWRRYPMISLCEWRDITPNRDIVWINCRGNCAKLRIEMAIRRQKIIVPRAGSVLFIGFQHDILRTYMHTYTLATRSISNVCEQRPSSSNYVSQRDEWVKLNLRVFQPAPRSSLTSPWLKFVSRAERSV